MHACTLSRFSPVQLSVTQKTAAHQAPLSVGFSRQEHWSGLPCPPPGGLPDLRIDLASACSTAGVFFTTESPRKPIYSERVVQILIGSKHRI